MPLKNFHACRIEEPVKFKKESFRTLKTKLKGLTFITAILKKTSKSELQSYRYDKKNWSASRANKHCITKNGTFEAAAKKIKKDIMPSDIPHLLESGANTAFMGKGEPGLAYKICIMENIERGLSIEAAKKECINFKKGEMMIDLNDKLAVEKHIGLRKRINNFIKKYI